MTWRISKGSSLRQGAGLDVKRVRQYGLLFAELKEEPDLVRPFEQSMARAGVADIWTAESRRERRAPRGIPAPGVTSSVTNLK